MPALIFAWAFELTPEGLKKERDVDRTQSIATETGKQLDRVIMVVLAVALGYFAFDKFVLAPGCHLNHQRTAEAHEEAEMLLKQALANVPNYAAGAGAHWQLARTIGGYPFRGHLARIRRVGRNISRPALS